MSPSEQEKKTADELCESVWRNRIYNDDIPAHYLRRQLVDSIAQALATAREQAVKPFIDVGLALPDGTPRKVVGKFQVDKYGRIIADVSCPSCNAIAVPATDSASYWCLSCGKMFDPESPTALASKEPRE